MQLVSVNLRKCMVLIYAMITWLCLSSCVWVICCIVIYDGYMVDHEPLIAMFTLLFYDDMLCLVEQERE